MEESRVNEKHGKRVGEMTWEEKNGLHHDDWRKNTEEWGRRRKGRHFKNTNSTKRAYYCACLPLMFVGDYQRWFICSSRSMHTGPNEEWFQKFRLCMSYICQHFLPFYWIFVASKADGRCPLVLLLSLNFSVLHTFMTGKVSVIAPWATSTEIIHQCWVLELTSRPRTPAPRTWISVSGSSTLQWTSVCWCISIGGSLFFCSVYYFND